MAVLAHVTVAVVRTTSALFFDFVCGRLCRVRLVVLHPATVFSVLDLDHFVFRTAVGIEISNPLFLFRFQHVKDFSTFLFAP